MPYVKTCLKPPLSFPSMSGSICTFNAQYALPLYSHKIALTATQSGSGTPSPDNVRTINGYSAIGVSATGKNLFSYDLPIRKGHWLGNVFNGTNEKVSLASASSWCYIAVPVVENSTITISNMLSQGGTSGAFLSSLNVNDTVGFFTSGTQNGTKTVPSGAKYMCLVFYNLNSNYSSYPNAQFEVGATATAFEPFGTYTTINLGGTYYFGEYDAISGLLTATHRLDIYDENSPFSSASNNRFTVGVSGIESVVACNLFEPVQPAGSTTSIPNYRCRLNMALDTMVFRNTDISDLTAWNTWVSNNNIQVLYKLATPQTIQLPPCPIDTIANSVNNIFADTGNTTLQYIKIGG